MKERDDDIPEEIRRELMHCAVQNGRISYHYLCDVWRRGHAAGYHDGITDLDGDPRIEAIDDGEIALREATGGEYTSEDCRVSDALVAGREFATRLVRRETHIQQLLSERRDLLRLLKLAADEFCSNRCPSVFRKPPVPHVDDCHAMRRVLESPQVADAVDRAVGISEG